MPMGPPSAPNPAQAAGIIMIVCAVAIAIGTFTKSWVGKSVSFGDESMEVGLGLLGMKQCSSGKCESAGWGDDDRGEIPGDIKAMGYLGFIAGLASIGACAAAGGLALSRNTHKIPHKVLLGILGAGSFSMVYFLVRIKMDDKVGGRLDISYSGIAAIGGLIAAGIVMKQMLVPLINRAKGIHPAALPMAYAQPMMGQPMQGQPMMGQPMAQAPMAAAATVTCPRCQGQATFVAQYNRHFCNACQQYV